jgi:glycosyltransferase involved in cell wall biosynthesis
MGRSPELDLDKTRPSAIRPNSLMAGVTILMPTLNRCAVLRETLEAMCCLDRRGIDCDFVVIDNGSTDATADVLGEYEARLPLTFLKEPRLGKNCALNKALRECRTRDIVVFTDDDVTPAKNWLQEIVSSARKWPDIAVFGGRVLVKWPNGQHPEWAGADWIKAFGYSQHDLGDKEKLYASPACPFGPNFWVRKAIFESVPFFDETFGPFPKDTMMGDETSFLIELHKLGFPMIYYPQAQVQHRIFAQACAIPALRRRGFQMGRGQVKFFGWHRRETYARSKILWIALLLGDYSYTLAKYGFGLAHRNVTRNCELTVGSMVRFGCLHQTLKEFNASRTSEPDFPGSQVGSPQTKQGNQSKAGVRERMTEVNE